MSTYRLDPITKEMATDYANEESFIGGFQVGSDKWKNAFKEYVRDAMSTMTVGRNPRGSAHNYKIKTELYPDIFGISGFAGQVAKNFTTSNGSDKGVTLEAIQNRLMSSINNLMRMFENGIMGVRNTTIGNKQGKIANSEMSELQLPNKEEFPNQEEFDAKMHDVLYNWVARDLIADAIMESLLPFFRLTSHDVEQILAAVNIENIDMKDIMKGRREEFIKILRAQVRPRMDQIIYKRLVLG